MSSGILVASDREAEWLLPWWIELYRACNTLPIAFVDLGMTSEACAFCKAHGSIITLKESCIVSAEYPAIWETSYGKSYAKARQAWFQKPFA